MLGDRKLVPVVVRYTQYDDVTPFECIELMSWHEDTAEADTEAARLNSVRRSDKVEYFVKFLRDRKRK